MPYRSLFVWTDFLVCNYVLRFNVIGGPEKNQPEGRMRSAGWTTLAYIIHVYGHDDGGSRSISIRLHSATSKEPTTVVYFFFVFLRVAVFLINVFKLIN
jgi:hypothetical protein